MRGERALLLPPLAVLALWIAYTVAVGGDFMEFRFLVPVIPLMMLFIVWLIFCYVQRPLFRLALVALVPLGCVHHCLTFDYATEPPLVREIHSVKQLQAYLEPPFPDWVGLGQKLGELFSQPHRPAGLPAASRRSASPLADNPADALADHSGEGVTIAVTSAGVLPFYSRLRSVDMHGLNDRWLARHGPRVTTELGHRILPPVEYLIRRGVNIVVGHPIVRPRAELKEPADLLRNLGTHPFKLAITDLADLPPEARIVEIPVNAQYSLIVLYLVRHPLVDRRIEEYRWRVVRPRIGE